MRVWAIRTWAKRCLVSAVLLWPLASSAADLPHISLFETDNLKVVVPTHWAKRVTHYNLDDLRRAENTINASLPADPERAKAIAEQLINTPKTGLRQGWEALMRIAQTRVEYVPAIVFGRGEAIWYGPHLDRAIAAWRLREMQP